MHFSGGAMKDTDALEDALIPSLPPAQRMVVFSMTREVCNVVVQFAVIIDVGLPMAPRRRDHAKAQTWKQ
jgi:hypothetical protein